MSRTSIVTRPKFSPCSIATGPISVATPFANEQNSELLEIDLKLCLSCRCAGILPRYLHVRVTGSLPWYYRNATPTRSVETGGNEHHDRDDYLSSLTLAQPDFQSLRNRQFPVSSTSRKLPSNQCSWLLLREPLCWC